MTTVTLRDYQIQAVDSIYQYFYKKGGNPLVLMPTGTGKSVVIAAFVESIYKKWPSQKVIMATHVKELIEQNYKKLIAYWPFAPVGIYSAGLKKRDTRHPVIYGGIASMVGREQEFGHTDLLLIDEAHLVSPEDKTNYQNFIKALRAINPAMKVIGFTATGFRLGYGKIYGEEDSIFTDRCFDITNLESFNRLIAEGYLAPLITKRTKMELDVSGVRKNSNGEFSEKALQVAVDKKEVTAMALREALDVAADRDHWLIFASGVDHAIHIADMLNNEFGVSALAIHSKMKDKERDAAIRKFQNGDVRVLVNNNILTTGFDSPHVDCIVCLRPTASAGLWVQMLGRGTRPCDGKENCLVLDFAGNTRKLGPINDPVMPRRKGEGGGEAPVKCCEQCDSWNHASARICSVCGAPFPIAVKITAQASEVEVIKGDMPKVKVFKVTQISHSAHMKKGRPPVMRVNYFCGLQSFQEYVCFEHPKGNYGLTKAHQWWRERTELEPPATVAKGLEDVGSLPSPTHIRVWLNPKSGYPEIMARCFDGTAFGTEAPTDDLPVVEAHHPMVLTPPTNKADLDADIPF